MKRRAGMLAITAILLGGCGHMGDTTPSPPEKIARDDSDCAKFRKSLPPDEARLLTGSATLRCDSDEKCKVPLLVSKNPSTGECRVRYEFDRIEVLKTQNVEDDCNRQRNRGEVTKIVWLLKPDDSPPSGWVKVPANELSDYSIKDVKLFPGPDKGLANDPRCDLHDKGQEPGKRLRWRVKHFRIIDLAYCPEVVNPSDNDCTAVDPLIFNQ
jgi:hypothetical protein